MHVMRDVCRSEDNLWEFVLSFHLQVIGIQLGGKCLHLLPEFLFHCCDKTLAPRKLTKRDHLVLSS